MNQFVWDLQYPDAVEVEGTNVMWAGDGSGARAIPGNYKVRLIEDKTLLAEQTFELRKDPRVKATDEDYKAQFDFVQKVNKKVSECHKTINDIRKIRTQVNGYLGTVKDTTVLAKLKKVSKPMLDSLENIEGKLMQTKAKAPQDVLANPIRLNDKIAGVASYAKSNGASRPNKQHYAAFEDLSAKLDKVLSNFKEIRDKKVTEFNDLVKQQQIPAILLEEKGK